MEILTILRAKQTDLATALTTVTSMLYNFNEYFISGYPALAEQNPTGLLNGILSLTIIILIFLFIGFGIGCFRSRGVERAMKHLTQEQSQLASFTRLALQHNVELLDRVLEVHGDQMLLSLKIMETQTKILNLISPADIPSPAGPLMDEANRFIDSLSSSIREV